MTLLARPYALILLGLASLALAAQTGCNSAGTCEYRFDQASNDGSIPAGLETCGNDWEKDACNPVKLSAATLGLKTSRYTFTKGAKCEMLGYKDCSGGRGISYYKTCPEELAKSAKAPSEVRAPQPARPTPQAPTELAAPLDIPADAPFRGAANGAVILQVFSDVQDPFSSRFWPTLNGLVASRSDVKVVFRHAPQPFHKDAMLAHQAALEAFTQKGNDGFWAMHDLLTKNARALERPALVGYAGTLKLDVAAFEKALDAGTHVARIEQDTKAAKDARLTGTPVTVFGTHISRGAVPKETLEAFIAGSR